MKTLILIVNADAYQALTDHLRELGVTGFTVSHVEGHGPHTAEDQFLSSRDRVVGFVPRVRVDIVLPSEQAAVVLDTLRTTGSALSGHGTFWVSPVEDIGRF